MVQPGVVVHAVADLDERHEIRGAQAQPVTADPDAHIEARLVYLEADFSSGALLLHFQHPPLYS